jgi:hypothetical protein
MKKNSWLLLAIAALAWFNAGTVWLIQFSCYPLWPRVGHDAFGTYFQFWQRSTWSVVTLPFALAAIGSVILLFVAGSELPRWMLWSGLALQAVIEFVRWIWVGPLEQQVARLSGPSEHPEYRRLIHANWLLIRLVTAYAALALWTWSRTAWSATANRIAGAYC